MAGEFLKDTLGNLVGSIEPKFSGLDNKYEKLESSKAELGKLVDDAKEKRVAEVIRGKDLSAIYKRIAAVEIADQSKRKEIVESIINDLFNIISDLNVDLLVSEEGSADYQNTLQLLAVSFYMYEKVLVPLLEEKEEEKTDAESVEDVEAKEKLSRKDFLRFLNKRTKNVDRILDFHISHKVNISSDDFYEIAFSFILSQTSEPSIKIGSDVLNKLKNFKTILTSFDVSNPSRAESDIQDLEEEISSIVEVTKDPELKSLIKNISELFKKYIGYMGSESDFKSGDELTNSLSDLPSFLHESSEVAELELLTDGITPNGLKKYEKEELEELKANLEKAFVDALPYLSSVTWVSYREVPKRVINILKKYYLASNAIEMILDPGFSAISMKDAAQRVLALNRDIYKYQAMKDPNSNIKDDVDLLYKRFGYLAGTSVFSDAVGILGHEYFGQTTLNLFKEGEITMVSEVNADGIRVEMTNNEKAMDLLLKFFRAAFDKREAAAAYDSLLNELRSLGKTDAEIENWGMKVYRELAREEVERNYWKVRVQLHFAKKEMEKEKAATVPRDRLYSELTRIIFDREEVLLASTAHPEYGQDITKMIDYVEDHAAMNNGDVVVRRQIVRPTINADRSPTTKREFILQRIKCPNLKGSEDQKAEIFRNFIAELKRNGEEIVYICDDKGFDERGYDETQPEKRGQKIASYTDLASMRSGINTLDTEFRVKFGAADEAKSMAALLFITFDRLNPILGELQTNTKTRAHNGDIEDVDRIAIYNVILGAVHRMFRYDDPGRDAASNCLTRFDKLPGADVSLLYSDKELKKRGYEDKNQYLTASGNPVRKEHLPFFGKSRKDHNWYAGAQLAANEYLQRFFDWDKVPKIRLRGFMEPLGYDTDMFFKLASGKITSGGKDEVIFDPTRGVVDPGGRVVTEIRSLQDLKSMPSKSNVTTWNFYPLAEENGYLKIEEMMNDKIADNFVDSNVVLSKIHDLWKLWGKVKMYPSPVIRESFVTSSYEFIMRAIHTCKDIQDNDRVKPLFHSVLGSLINNMVEGGGLVDYQEEMATLVNLLCKHPIYRYDSASRKAVRIDGVKPEPSDSWFNHAERYVEKDRYAVTYLMHHLLTRAYRLPNDIIQSAMMERPKLFEGFSKLSIFDFGTWFNDKVAGPWGLRDVNIVDLEEHLRSGVPGIFDRSGSLIQPKEKEK